MEYRAMSALESAMSALEEPNNEDRGRVGIVSCLFPRYALTVVLVSRSTRVIKLVHYIYKLQLRNQKVHQRRLDERHAGNKETNLHSGGEGGRVLDLLKGGGLLLWGHDEELLERENLQVCAVITTPV